MIGEDGLPNDIQTTLANAMRINKAWYNAVVGKVYFNPILNDRNIDLFARTLCVGASCSMTWPALFGIGQLVHHLDLQALRANYNYSMVASLIAACQANLETFQAPATGNFGVQALKALGCCENLLVANLGLVHGQLNLRFAFEQLQKLPKLRRIGLPKLLPLPGNAHPLHWPASLQELSLGGSPFVHSLLKNESLLYNRSLGRLSSTSLSALQIHGGVLSGHGLCELLSHIGPKLRALGVTALALTDGSLDDVLLLCPNLQRLQTSPDFFSLRFLTNCIPYGATPSKQDPWDGDGLERFGRAHPLTRLELDLPFDPVPGDFHYVSLHAWATLWLYGATFMNLRCLILHPGWISVRRFGEMGVLSELSRTIEKQAANYKNQSELGLLIGTTAFFESP